MRPRRFAPAVFERYAGMMNFSTAALGISLLLATSSQAASLAIADGRIVTLEYTISDDAGKTIDSSEGKKPMVYTQGSDGVPPALQKALIGLHTGDEKEVKLAPKDAFGEIDPKATVEVPKEKIPAEGQVVGAFLSAQAPDGRASTIRVQELKEKTIVLDTNHPLAGKTLVFKVKVASVAKAPKLSLDDSKGKDAPAAPLADEAEEAEAAEEEPSDAAE